MTRTRRTAAALLGAFLLSTLVAEAATAAAPKRPPVSRPKVKLGGEETDGVAPTRPTTR